jgi:HSP20 family protein
MEKTKKTNGTFQREFEIAQLLREINPGFRRGVTPVTSPTHSYDTVRNPGNWNPTANTWPGTTMNNWNTPTGFSMNPTNNFATNTPWGPTWNTPYGTPTGMWTAPTGVPMATTTPHAPNTWATPPYDTGYWRTAMHNGNGSAYAFPSYPPPAGWENGSQAVPVGTTAPNTYGTTPETGYTPYGSTPYSGNTSSVTPPTNVVEYENRFCIEMMVAGFNEKDCSIRVSNGILWVHGWKNDTTETKEPNLCTTCEFNTSTFRRCFMVSEDVDVENIKATCTNGVLTLTLPKKVLATQKEKKVSELS